MDNLFQQAKDAITNVTQQGNQVNEQDKQIAQRAIKAAYQNATAEEKQQLQQFEQELEQNQLS